MAVAAQGGIVAYVDALDAEADESSANEFAAMTLSRAVEAVTIEAARRRAATEAESRVRGHFLWSLASGTMDPDADIAGDASLLGYNPRGAHHVVVVEADERPGAKELERRLARQGRHLELSFHTARRGTTLLLLIEAGDTGSESIARRVLEELQAKRPVTKEVGFAAGIADGAWALRDLASAYAVAQRTLEIGRSIVGAHCVAHACDLGPFLMISHLADDPQANETALSTLGPLIAYDRKTGRDLVETLETYLEEGQNATRTARQLFLSRHALLYRLRKIEQLTTLSLESRDDRFILELSLRLLRFGVLDVDQLPQ
jgi:sugar diacid utilization regulator